MKRFKLSTEVLFSEDAIDALLEVKDVNAVLITDKFMVDSGMADMILKKLSNCIQFPCSARLFLTRRWI